MTVKSITRAMACFARVLKSQKHYKFHNNMGKRRVTIAQFNVVPKVITRLAYNAKTVRLRWNNNNNKLSAIPWLLFPTKRRFFFFFVLATLTDASCKIVRELHCTRFDFRKFPGIFYWKFNNYLKSNIHTEL